MTHPRSRMAVLALIALAAAPTARGDEPIANTVRLQLQITGVAPEGCVVEIRPGHPGCKFAPVARQVQGYTGGETVRLDPIPVLATTTGADRDCSFAITIREPGQPPRTYRRGLRLMPARVEEPNPVQNLNVFLSTPSLASRDVGDRVRR